MKFFFLAAAALITAPVIAQDAPMTPPADQAAPAPADSLGTMAPAPAPAGDPMAADPAGGYQPATTATQGPPPPGATIRFQPPQTPDQAYPAPAPMAKYPLCKKGQYDNCRQRGGR